MADIFMPPASGDTASGVDTAAGTPDAGGKHDPSQVTGQDPDSILGIPVSYESGAGGTPAPGGESEGTCDPTVMPNQYPARDPISGVTLGGSGAPGSQGLTASATPSGGTSIQVTDPSLQGAPAAGESGTQLQSVSIDVAGPNDSTAAADNYPPRKPIVDGDFYPTPDSPSQPGGGGRVLVGGFKKGQRDDAAPAETAAVEDRAMTWPGGPGVASGDAGSAVMNNPGGNPVNTSDAPNVQRPRPADPGGTRSGAWVKTADYPSAGYGGDSPPWRQV